MSTIIQTPIRFGAWEGTAYHHDHRWWVPARPICEFLGLSWSRQRRVILALPGDSVVALKATAADGKSYEMLMLQTGKLGLWLAGISPSRVAESARPALLDMQARLDEALTRQIEASFGIPAAADLTDLLEAPLPAGADAAAFRQARAAALGQPHVAQAATLFRLGLPGTKTGALVGRSAYWARKRRRELEALGMVELRRPAAAPQPDLFGEGSRQ